METKKVNEIELVDILEFETDTKFKNNALKVKSLAPRIIAKDFKIYVTKDVYNEIKDEIKEPAKRAIFFNGNKDQPIVKFLAERGLTIKRFNERVRRGWTYEEALNTPIGELPESRQRKKRVQAFIDVRASKGGSKVLGGNNLLPTDHLSLNKVTEYLDIREENAVDEFNKKENENFTRDDRKKGKK